MSKAKYKSVLDLVEKFQLKHRDVKEEDGKLFINGFTSHQYQKDVIWNEIKSIGGEDPMDLRADIGVTDNSVYAEHTVQAGESLTRIAQQYYGSPNQYQAIVEANSNQITDENAIQTGQLLKIPHL